MLIHRMVQKISRRGGKSAFLSAIGFSTKDSKMKDSKTKDGYELATKYKGWEIYTFPTSLTFPFVAYDKDKNVIKGFNLIEIKGEIDKRESASTTDDLMTPSQKRKIEELEAAIKSNQMAGHTNRVDQLEKELADEKSKISVQQDSATKDAKVGDMTFQKGYELERLISKLRIRGMNSDANKLEENQSTNGLSEEAIQIIKAEARPGSTTKDAPNYYQAIVEVARRQNNTKATREAIRSQLEPIVAAYNIPFNEEQFNQAFSEFRKAGNPRAAYFKGRDAKTKDESFTAGQTAYYSFGPQNREVKIIRIDPNDNMKYEVKWNNSILAVPTHQLSSTPIKDTKSRDGRDHLMERYKGVDIFYDKTEGTYWAAPRGGIGVTGNSVGQIRSKIDTFRSQQNTHDAKNLADLPDVKYKGYLISLNAYGEYFVSRNNHGNWQPIPNAKFGNENNAKSYIDTLPKVTTDRKSNLHPRWRKSGDKAAIRKIKDCLMSIKKTRDGVLSSKLDELERKLEEAKKKGDLAEINKAQKEYDNQAALMRENYKMTGSYDSSAPKEFNELREWQNAAMDLGYRLENNQQRGMWVAYQGNSEVGTFVPTRGGRLYVKDSFRKSSFGTKSYTQAELTNLAKRGELEVNTDIKPRQHVEVRWPNGKREMVWVEDAKMTKDQNETYSQLKSQLAATERQLAQSRKLGESADVREAEAEIAQLKKQIASLEQAGKTKDSKDIYTNFFSGFLRKG